MIPPSERLPLHLSCSADLATFFEEQRDILVSFGRASDVTIGTAMAKPAGSVADVVRGVEIFLVVAGKVDFEKERQRLTKELERLRGQIVGIEKKLGNPGFVNGAKPEVVESERRKLADWTATAEKLERNLASLQ